MTDASTSGSMSPVLSEVAERARREPQGQFHSLAHLIDVEALRRAYQSQRPDAAVGMDGVTKETYGRDLEANLQALLCSSLLQTVLDVAHQYPHRPGTGSEDPSGRRQLAARHGSFDGGGATAEQPGDTLFGDDRTGLQFAQRGDHTRELNCFISALLFGRCVSGQGFNFHLVSFAHSVRFLRAYKIRFVPVSPRS